MTPSDAKAGFRRHHSTQLGMLRICCIVGASVAMSSAALAAGVSFDVKPGLWEVRTSGTASGMPQIPPEALAKLKPEERALAEVMLQAIFAQASLPHMMQFCVTPEQVRQGLDVNRMGGKDCQRTVQSSSSEGLDMQVQCGGPSGMNGVVHLRVVDRGTVAGHVDLQAGFGATTATLRQDLHGRWLGAACGDVKPMG